LRVNFSLQDALSWPNGLELPGKMAETIPSAPTRTIDRAVHIEIPIEFQILLYRPDNQADRSLMFQILEGLGTVLANNGCQNTLAPDQCWKMLDKHAPIGAKKKLVGVNIGTRPALNPDGISPFRKLESHDVEEQLDDLALELNPRPPVGELHDAAEAVAVCNELGDLYLSRIKSAIQVFSWESLLREVIAQHEAYWHMRAYEEITTATSIECYGDVDSHVARLVRDLTRAEETAVALRLLIEIIAAEPPIGRKLVSMAEADRLVAMASHLINWGMLSDHIHLGIINYKLSILPSGRIGVDPKDSTGAWEPFTAAKTLENVELDISDFAKHFRSEPSAPSDPALIDCLEKAFAAEFGMTRTDIIRFFRTLTAIGFELRTASAALPKSELTAQMQKRLGLHEDYLNPLLNLFSLQPRPKWEKAPNGFNEREDIWPWRYNRRLSYLRRPLVVGSDPKNDPLVCWGPRHVDEALRNLFGLVETGRYKLQPNSSKDMSDLLSEIEGNASKKYVRDVKEWLEGSSAWEVHAEVPIRPGKPLHADDNLGDIDILCIDRGEKRIFSIECKNVNFGRSPREIANELEKFLGKDDAKKQSWIEKHQKRHEWLEAHLELVIQVYALDTGSWQVASLFLISEEISATYLRQMPWPFLSFPRLRREGLAALATAVTS